MTSVIQNKRRINGAPGSPAAAGSVEGELAINFPKAAGASDKPAIWAFDGVAWRQANPDVAVTVGVATLPGGTAGSATGIGAAYTALATKPSGSITIATFAGTAYVLTGAGGADTDWTALGAATAFATAAEILAGTDASKAINALGLQSRLATAPNATPAKDAGKIPALDAKGLIPAGFLPVGGLNFSGTLDPTVAAGAGAPAGAVNGQFYTVTKAGAIDAAWKPFFANAGLTTVAIGDYMVWDDTAKKFHHVANAVDMSAYVPLAGTTGMIGNVLWQGAAGSKKGTIIVNGKGGTLEEVVVDGGTY